MLRVWLPLTKDLRNQGLSNVTITNNGATYSATNGKLGGCYSLDSTSINIGKPLPSPCAAFTVAGWVNLLSGFTANNGFHLLSFGQTYGRVCVSKDNAALQTLIPSNTGGTAGSSCPSSMANTAIVAGVWHYYVVTYNAGLVKIYIDGVLDKEYNTGISSFTYTNNIIIGTYSAESCKGLLNDYRLYDHALSQMEVKELSKGLVLHYPLNRGGWGQENLLKGTDTGSGWSYSTFDASKGVFTRSTTSTSESYVHFSGYNVPVEAGVTYTLSCYAKSNGFVKSMDMYKYNSSVQNIQYTAYNLTTDYKLYTFTFTPQATENVTIRFDNNGSTTSGTEAIMYIKHPKLEKGSIATPWCPNSSDALATTMGLNGTTEYDTSGYCNNGIRMGTFSWTSNTPKYEVSQVFNGTDNAIQTPSLPTMIIDKNYTIAVWIYKTAIGSKNYQTIYGGPSGFELEARNGTTTEAKFVGWNWGKPAAAYEFNEWNHCVFVHSDDDCKVYLNGEYVATGTAKASNPSGNYFIGAWNTATQQNFEGLMSDFRIYATALSADDVKSLYQNSAYIDSSGNVYGAVHSEV